MKLLQSLTIIANLRSRHPPLRSIRTSLCVLFSCVANLFAVLLVYFVFLFVFWAWLPSEAAVVADLLNNGPTTNCTCTTHVHKKPKSCNKMYGLLYNLLSNNFKCKQIEVMGVWA